MHSLHLYGECMDNDSLNIENYILKAILRIEDSSVEECNVLPKPHHSK